MVQWRKLIAGVLVLMFSQVVLAEETAESWLQKMLSASRQVSYQGHSILLSGGKVTSLAIYHAPVNDEVWERVVHLSGEPAEILRKGSVVTCLHPGSSSQLNVQRTPQGKLTALEESAQTVSRYYRFTRAGMERVAGREGVRIDVSPLDNYRYGYSLWLDEATGVLLKSQTNPADGDPLEVFEFVSLDIGSPVSLASFEPSSDLAAAANNAIAIVEDASPQPDDIADIWVPKWLPDGFRQAGRTSIRADKPAMSARVYTDGLASFTVFFEPGTAGQRETSRAHGATVAVNHVIPETGQLVTVVGEIPQATAARVAENVKPLAGQP